MNESIATVGGADPFSWSSIFDQAAQIGAQAGLDALGANSTKQVQTQQAPAVADSSISKQTLIYVGVGVAALVALVLLLRK